MKRILTLGLFIVLLSCGGSKKEAVNINFENYKSYFLKNDVVTDDEIFYFASDKLIEFDKYFSPAATMSRQKWIDDDNLMNQTIISIVNKTDGDTEKVEIKSVKYQGNTLFIDYTINKSEQPASLTTRKNVVAVVAARNLKNASFS